MKELLLTTKSSDEPSASHGSFKAIASDLVIYLIFSILVSFNSLEYHSTEYFQLTEAVTDLFKGQYGVTNMDEFWKFIENDVIHGLYWDSWYCQNCKAVLLKYPNGELDEKLDSMDQNIIYENKLIGLPLMRQLRTRNDSCYVHEDFRNAIKICHSPYHVNYEDKYAFNPNLRYFTDYSAWHHLDQKNGSGINFNGNAGVYSVGGSLQLLSHFKQETQQIIAELKQNLWITEATRFVSLNFNIYNPNTNIFCIVSLVFEFSATGNIFNFQSIDAIKLLEHTTIREFIVLGSEIVVLFFIIYYIIEELFEIKRIGIAYYRQFWNIVDTLVIMTSILQISMKILTYFYTRQVIEELLEKTLDYPDFSYVLRLHRALGIISSVNAFIVWIKFLKYLTFNKMTAQLSKTLSLAATDLSGFSILFLVVEISFVLLSYLMFGVQLENFKTFMDSFFTLFRMILGDFNFNEIEEVSPFLGPIFFIVYIFFVFFVLLNVFLAIINDTYSVVKSEESEENELQNAQEELQKFKDRQDMDSNKLSQLIDDDDVDFLMESFKSRKWSISHEVLDHTLVISLENRIQNLESLILPLRSRLESLLFRMENKTNKKVGLNIDKKRMEKVFDSMVLRE